MHQRKQKNHYVPRSYLKLWSDSEGYLNCYRILVSHERSPLWKRQSVKSVAFHQHLYTGLVAGQERDDIERWFDSEFESPAAEPLKKVLSGSRLTPADWRCLVLLLAAQDVRTPARLLESMKRWNETLPELIEETLTESAAELELAHREGRKLTRPENPAYNSFPGRTVLKAAENEESSLLGYEMVIGRSLWLWSLKHLLTNTSNALLGNRWTILVSPPGIEWLTSDNPVVRLNYYGPGKYDLTGGWGNPGTEIFMPLSPRHLIYTQVGHKPPAKSTVLTSELASTFQRFIVENAHRYIFSHAPAPEVAEWRPRVVDGVAFSREAEQWKRWHQEQIDEEQRLARK